MRKKNLSKMKVFAFCICASLCFHNLSIEDVPDNTKFPREIEKDVLRTFLGRRDVLGRFVLSGVYREAFLTYFHSFISAESIEEVSSALEEEVSNATIDTKEIRAMRDCSNELNITEDIFMEEEIITEVHLRPNMEERKRQNGCLIECILKKLGMMEGTEFKEEKIHEEITKDLERHSKKDEAHKTVHDCVKEVTNITQECEKGFALLVCFSQSIHRLLGHREHPLPPI